MPSLHPPPAHRAPSAHRFAFNPTTHRRIYITDGTNETKWNTFSNSHPPHPSPKRPLSPQLLKSTPLHFTNVTGCYTLPSSLPHPSTRTLIMLRTHRRRRRDRNRLRRGWTYSRRSRTCSRQMVPPRLAA